MKGCREINHLHALAAVAREQAMESIGLVRGGEQETAMLADARGWGMQVIKLSREEYRRRNDPAYLDEIAARFSPCLVIPEGGANAAGVKGCREIAQLIREVAPGASRIVLPVGTGTTLAGIVSGLAPTVEVVGISALKGALDLDQRVRVALAGEGIEQRARWRILHDHHCGGFARVNLSWLSRRFTGYHLTRSTRGRCCMPSTVWGAVGSGVPTRQYWRCTPAGCRGGGDSTGRAAASNAGSTRRDAELVAHLEIGSPGLAHEIAIGAETEIRPLRVLLVEQVGQAQGGLPARPEGAGYPQVEQ